jgi:prepilin-type processing-associated H-X9-DG protein/prepilin-type N-terminal cleavage/methylation domain-containing protein
MNVERPHTSIASHFHPVVIPTGGQAKPGRNGGISLRTGGTPDSWPDPFGKLRAGSSTPRCCARDDKTGGRSAQNGRVRRAFTLIELLVVISVIVLLMALLLPALSRARKQARAVACQSNLHQWSVLLAAQASEDGYLSMTHHTIRSVSDPNGTQPWNLALCPSARRPLPGDSVGYGDTFHAHSVSRDRYGTGRGAFSYGLNGWFNVVGFDWPAWDMKGATRVPILFDCAIWMPRPDHHDPPPECEGHDPLRVMSDLCINRHNGGTNMLFADWSVRKVGIKEHWTFKWHRDYDTSGPWTKARGVQPQDWPEWMRGFKDY